MAEASIEQRVLERMVRALADALRPERIILFGSVARGEARADSDIDLFVQIPSGQDTSAAARRGYAALRPLRSELRRGVDLVVKDRAFVERFGDLVGCVVRSVKQDGKVLYDRA